MRASIKTSNVAGGLEKYYSVLNKHYFGGDLPFAIIVFTHSSNPAKNVWTARGIEQFEINIPHIYLSSPVEDMISFLLHQMTHIYCYLNGIKDTSNNGLYHNSRFRCAAESHGLLCEKSQKYYGWNNVSPSEDLIELIEKEGWNNFQMSGGIYINKFTYNSYNKNCVEGTCSNSRKYVCPCCGVIIRATREVDVVCGKCGEKFITNYKEPRKKKNIHHSRKA